MHEKLLEDIGLTKNESRIYLTLLRIGKSKSGKLVKEAKTSGGKIYETLNKLVDKGLVKIVVENGIKHFIANNPKTVLDYLKERENNLREKEKEFKKLLPSFENLKKTNKPEELVSMIKGFRGISTIIYDCLEKGKGQIYIMGIRSSKDEKFNRFWINWHKKRIELKKEAKMIFSDEGGDYLKFFKKLKFTKVKKLLHLSPSAIMILDNNTFIFSYEKELTCIHMNSESITKSMLNFFNDLWKISK